MTSKQNSEWVIGFLVTGVVMGFLGVGLLGVFLYLFASKHSVEMVDFLGFIGVLMMTDGGLLVIGTIFTVFLLMAAAQCEN